MKIEIIETQQYNSYLVVLELIVNDTILMTKAITKEEIFEYLDYEENLDDIEYPHYTDFESDYADMTEFTESELQDYLDNNLIINETN